MSVPQTQPSNNHLVRLEREYHCSQCGSTRVRTVHAVTQPNGSVTVWGSCAQCDNQGNRAGEPDFDPIQYPRLNVMKWGM